MGVTDLSLTTVYVKWLIGKELFIYPIRLIVSPSGIAVCQEQSMVSVFLILDITKRGAVDGMSRSG